MWQPSHFILHGVYCDSSSIAELLEELRLKADCEALVLLAVENEINPFLHGTALFEEQSAANVLRLHRSLFLIAHRTKGHGENAGEKLDQETPR